MADTIAMEAAAAPLDELLRPFSTIQKDWMLITAGSGIGRSEWNTMTASWGSFGTFWNRPCVTCVIRPSRHTFTFVEREKLVTFSFFEPSFKHALQVCGSTTGVTTDKATAASITPVLLEPGAVGFAESRVNLVCRKIYSSDVDPAGFADESFLENYPQKDFHRMFVCEIIRAYAKKGSLK